MLNALRVVVLYNRLRANPRLDLPARTFFFAGKAAPAYHLAKLIIKFINNLAAVIDGDPAVRGRLKVVFLPDYCVSLAERLIPASDVSNQISTAGYEASGTSNMKFMMNGALTIGTRDGATIEMAQEAGEENFFLFGLTAEQVANTRGWYNPRWHYENEPETRFALDLISANHFSPEEHGIFSPIVDTLLAHGDHYLHLADLKSYLEADQKPGGSVWRTQGLGEQGDLERGQFREVFQRPDHLAVRSANLESATVPGVMNNPEHQVALPPFSRAPYVRGVDACHLAAFTLRHRGRGAGGFCVGGPAPRCRPVVVAGSAFGANWMWQLALLMRCHLLRAMHCSSARTF